MKFGDVTYIHVGQMHVDRAPHVISTILGSCVAVCLYDKVLHIGGMNHYLLPFWDSNGLQSPRYGNLAIPKMIEMIQQAGSELNHLEAKIFGGASIHIGGTESMMIGQKNILVARELLKNYGIPIVAEDVGGLLGRKIQFNLDQGKVLLKYTSSKETTACQ